MTDSDQSRAFCQPDTEVMIKTEVSTGCRLARQCMCGQRVCVCVCLCQGEQAHVVHVCMKHFSLVANSTLLTVS